MANPTQTAALSKSTHRSVLLEQWTPMSRVINLALFQSNPAKVRGVPQQPTKAALCNCRKKHGRSKPWGVKALNCSKLRVLSTLTLLSCPHAAVSQTSPKWVCNYVCQNKRCINWCCVSMFIGCLQFLRRQANWSAWLLRELLIEVRVKQCWLG